MPIFPQPKPRARILMKRDARLDAEREQRAVYAAIDARDQRRCRVCLRKGDYGLGGEKALHRHHLIYRSKGGVSDSRTLITVCAICHSLIHAKQLWPLSHDADKTVSWEIHEAAVVEVFANKPLPPHVHIVTEARR